MRKNIGLSTMILVLVLLASALLSEAGRTQFPYSGLHWYPAASNHAVRQAVVRSYGSRPTLENKLNSYERPTVALRHSAPPVLSNYGIGHAKTHIFTTPLREINPTPFSYVPLGSANTFNFNYPFNPALTSHVIKGPRFSSSNVSPVFLNMNHSPMSAIVNNHIPSHVAFNPSLGAEASYITANEKAPIINAQYNPSAIGNIYTRLYTVEQNPIQISQAIASDSNTHSAHNPPKTENIKLVDEIPDKAVSYSISNEDYDYLKRHKTEGKDSPYNLEHNPPQDQHHPNTHSHHKEPAAKKPNDDNVLKRKSENNDNSYESSEYGVPSIVAAEPVVSKDIYFHIPPPDIEEAPSTIAIPEIPKKKYNIIFIKAPTQNTRNYDLLQQLSDQSNIEHKTLIYVLAKDQEPLVHEVLPPLNYESSPEVFFIKYKSKLGDLTEINDSVVDSNLLDSISPIFDRKRDVKDSEVVENNLSVDS